MIRRPRYTPSLKLSSGFPLYAGFGLITAGLLVYSQTMAFHWDEGFHLLTAQLILEGKHPYADFVFAQTPLSAYWNALWMRVFGESWRLVHAVAALETVAAVLLMAQYVRSIFPAAEWRLAGGLAALALFGLQMLVFDFGALAQAYGLCLLLVVAAFRLAILAPDRPPWLAAMAGFCAAAAAGASLLTAAVGPTLLLWMWIYNREGSRLAKAAAYLGGAALALLPVARLFLAAPKQAWFDLVQYHALYRRADWPGATQHDINVFSSWINDGQDLVLILLALAGLVYLRKGMSEARLRGELWLCVWLPAAVALQNSVAHPTFRQYFLWMIPFAAVFASLGFYQVASRLSGEQRWRRALALLATLMVLGLGRGLFDGLDTYSWRQLEKTARKVQEVTPKNAELLAPEQIYFLTRRPVPMGLEFIHLRKLDLGTTRNRELHILPLAEIDRRLKAGRYATAVVCDDDDRISQVDGWKLYGEKDDIGDCTVFARLKAGH